MLRIILCSFFAATSLTIPLPNVLPANERTDLKGISTFIVKNFNLKKPAEKSTYYYPDFKQFGREEAVLEQEHWLSAKDSVYNRAQGIAAKYLKPQPIVDTIKEHEKYGNDGGTSRKIATFIINSFDAIGNVGNAVVDLPFKAKDEIAKTLNAALNAVGGPLVGI